MKRRVSFLLFTCVTMLASMSFANDIVRGFNRTSFTLRDTVAKTSSENYAFSPLSISTALSMTYAGAAGSTMALMKSVLNFGDNGETFHRGVGSLLESARYSDVNTKSSPRVNIVNDLWLQADFDILPKFTEDLQRGYGAQASMLDFNSDAAKATATINQHVATATQNEIPTLFKTDLEENTRFVLTNAIFFDAKWQHKFMGHNTFTSNFTMSSGAPKTVNYLTQTNYFNYGEDDTKQYLMMRFRDDDANEKYSAIFVLPKVGHENLVINAESFITMTKNMNLHTVAVKLPKFEVRSSPNMKDTLTDMGLGVLFDRDQADLSGINGETSGPKKLFLSDVVHETVVKLYEDGMTATASTAVIGAVRSSIRVPEKSTFEFTADRPFHFFILNNVPEADTPAIMFMGRINEPSDA